MSQWPHDRPNFRASANTSTMLSRYSRPDVLGAPLLLAALACSSAPTPSARDVVDANDTGRTLAGNNDTERALLARVGKLPSGNAQQIGGASVVAQPPYVAASGRTCRALLIAAAPARPAQHRLACSNGESWFFVPDVFGSSGE